MNDIHFDIETETAGRYGDATEADLHRLVHLMDASNSYLILHPRGDNDRFAQVALQRKRDGTLRRGYLVEYRNGTEPQQQTTVRTADEAYELLAGWAFDRPGWKEAAKWKPVKGGYIDLMRACVVEEREGRWSISLERLGLTGEGPTREEAREALDALLLETFGVGSTPTPEMREEWLAILDACFVPAATFDPPRKRPPTE